MPPHLCGLAQALQQTQHDLVGGEALAATPPQEVQEGLDVAVKPAAGGSRAVTRRRSWAAQAPSGFHRVLGTRQDPRAEKSMLTGCQTAPCCSNSQGSPHCHCFCRSPPTWQPEETSRTCPGPCAECPSAVGPPRELLPPSVVWQHASRAWPAWCAGPGLPLPPLHLRAPHGQPLVGAGVHNLDHHTALLASFSAGAPAQKDRARSRARSRPTKVTATLATVLARLQSRPGGQPASGVWRTCTSHRGPCFPCMRAHSAGACSLPRRGMACWPSCAPQGKSIRGATG